MLNFRTPPSLTNRDALSRLEECIDTLDDGATLTREAAVSCLTDDESEQTEARDQIEQLLLKGHLYQVAEEIRIPPRRYD